VVSHRELFGTGNGLLEERKMGNNENRKSDWNLSVFRHADQGDVDNLDEFTQFRFGRFASEFDNTPVSALSKGLISIIKGQGLEGDALESGFYVDMTTREAPSDWLQLELLARHQSWLSMATIRRNPRGVYASESIDGCIEVVELDCCGSTESTLPTTISIRVAPLPFPIMAWGFNKGFFKGPKTHQMHLGNWVDLPDPKPEKAAEILALPGPMETKYDFFNGKVGG
jgi:hypothetical protein